jgi:hypothetical protein
MRPRRPSGWWVGIRKPWSSSAYFNHCWCQCLCYFVSFEMICYTENFGLKVWNNCSLVFWAVTYSGCAWCMVCLCLVRSFTFLKVCHLTTGLVLRLCTMCGRGKKWYGVFLQWYGEKRTEILGANSISVLLRASEIPQELAWNWYRTSKAKGRRVTA